MKISFTAIDYVVFLLTILGAFFISRHIVNLTKKEKDTWSSYLLMGRQLTLPFFVITLVSSWYGGNIGATQIAYNYGMHNFIVIGVFWYLGAVLFAIFLCKRIRRAGVLDLPELIEQRIGPKSAMITRAAMYIKTLPIAYVIAFDLCLGVLLDLPMHIAGTIGLLMVFCIGMIRGLGAVVLIDIMQFILIFLAIFFIDFYSVQTYGGMGYLKSTLPSSHFEMMPETSYGKALLWLLIAISTTFLSPIFHQRCMAAASDKVAFKGIFISILFWIVSDILTTTCGLYARAAMGEGYEVDALLQYMNVITPDGIKGFCYAALLVTCFSALDSYYFAAQSLLMASIKHRKQGKIPYWGKVASGLLTIALTDVISRFFNQDIESVWLYFDGIFIAILLPLTIKAIWLKRQYNPAVEGGL